MAPMKYLIISGDINSLAPPQIAFPGLVTYMRPYFVVCVLDLYRAQLSLPTPTKIHLHWHANYLLNRKLLGCGVEEGLSPLRERRNAHEANELAR